ncbi:MAG: hypothetical protein JXR63_13345 [Spirochaetales bacterium]|nr:hypothetical protein [Spirochaetales bacterium]
MKKEILCLLRKSLKRGYKWQLVAMLCAVFFVKSWDLFYSIFTMPLAIPVAERVEFLTPMFKSAFDFVSLLVVVGIAVGILAFIYIVSFVSRALAIVIKSRIDKQIGAQPDETESEKKAKKESVHTDSTADCVHENGENLDSTEDENLFVRSEAGDRAWLERYKDKDLHDIQKEAEVANGSVHSDDSPSMHDQEKIKKQLKAKSESSKEVGLNAFYKKIKDDIIENNLQDDFGQIVSAIQTGSGINETEFVGQLLSNSLIMGGYDPNRDVSIYEFTELGDEFLNFYRSN